MATLTGRLRIGPDDHGRRMTLQEFYEAEVVGGYRYELARGVLEVSDIPDDAHGMIVYAFYAAFADYQREHPNRILRCGGAAEFRFWLPGLASCRAPDLAVVLRGAPKDYRDRRIPALAMEIVSPGRENQERDSITKREEYLAYGLLEYWIIDPIAGRVIVLTRRGDVWDEHIFTEGQEAEGLVLPGFRMAVAELVRLYADEGKVS